MVWIGIGSGEEALAALQAATERELGPLGFEPEHRRFSPHLTLGRFRTLPTRAEAGEMERIAQVFEHQRFGRVRIDEVRLMRSDLHPSGPVYSVIEAFTLAG